MSKQVDELTAILSSYGELRIMEPDVIPLPKGELIYYKVNLQLGPGLSFANRAKTLELAMQEIYDHIHECLLEECGL